MDYIQQNAYFIVLTLTRWNVIKQQVSAGKALGKAASSLEKAGAEFIVVCTNTMHKVIDYIEERITIPVLQIVDATATHIQNSNIKTVGLLGTKYTMEQDFYKSRIEWY